MRLRQLWTTALVASAVLGASPEAGAAVDPLDGVTTPTDPLVVGGSFAQPCEWPTSIALRGGGCSATLIHPQVALSAAHCGSAGQVQFGEDWGSPAATAPVEFCARFEGWTTGNGTDIMVCKLLGSVNLPIVPVMHGCDQRELDVGDSLIPVGFGRQTAGGPGTPGAIGDKKWLNAELLGFPSDGAQLGIVGTNPEEGICNGDSGGSLYFQMADGTWRMIGITSTGAGGCPTTSQHVPTWGRAVVFIEETTGIDVTPCHDTDGRWNPGPDCTGFPLDPGSGAGKSWSNGCVGPMVSGPVATCGPAFGEPPDTNPPEVSITAPQDRAELPADVGSVPVTLNVNDPDGWGVWDVTLIVDGDAGMEEVVLDAEPWEFGSVDLPAGAWSLTAIARDWSGNEAEHKIEIFIGLDAPPPPEGSTGGDESPATGGGTGGGTDTDPAADGGEGGGSGGCRLAPGGPAGAWLLLILGLAWRRRD